MAYLSMDFQQTHDRLFNVTPHTYVTQSTITHVLCYMTNTISQFVGTVHLHTASGRRRRVLNVQI